MPSWSPARSPRRCIAAQAVSSAAASSTTRARCIVPAEAMRSPPKMNSAASAAELLDERAQVVVHLVGDARLEREFGARRACFLLPPILPARRGAGGGAGCARRPAPRPLRLALRRRAAARGRARATGAGLPPGARPARRTGQCPAQLRSSAEVHTEEDLGQRALQVQRASSRGISEPS